MASEIEAQKFVHSLEHGKGRKWVIFLLIVSFALFQSVAHVLINPLNRHGGHSAIFVGLTHPKGIEQAVVARELMRGNGFSTTTIKPAEIALIEKNKGVDGFMAYLGPDSPTRGSVPDIYHAPLSPWINSFALKVAVKTSDLLHMRVNAKGEADFWPMQQAEYIHPADRVIAGVSVFFFLAAVAMTFLCTRRIFDERLATLTVVLMLLCNQFWNFASTGLPQMLMVFLFSTALYFIIRALDSRERGTRTWPWLASTGLAFGLLALAHPITLFVFVGALIYVAISFRPIGRDPVIMVLIVLACITPWLLRNYRVSGSPFGIAGQSVMMGVTGSESQIMRTLKKDDDYTPAINFRSKIQLGLLNQLNSIVGRLGTVIVAPLFFLCLLHGFKKRETRSLRWGVLLMLLFGAFGMALVGFGDGNPQTDLQSNDLYPLFIPAMAAYGLSIVLVMWSRVTVAGRELAHIRQANIAFQTLLIITSAFPLLNIYTDPPRLPFVWPPICPPILDDLAQWYPKDNVICSDMPWGVAWYSDRRSLWLPMSVPDFNNLNEFRFRSKVTGLFFTPVTGNLPLLTDIGTGEYKGWTAFIMRDPRAATNFPLKVARPIHLMGAANYLIFADRDRWTQRND